MNQTTYAFCPISITMLGFSQQLVFQQPSFPNLAASQALPNLLHLREPNPVVAQFVESFDALLGGCSYVLMDKDGKLSSKLTGLFGTEDMLEDFELHYSPFPANRATSSRSNTRWIALARTMNLYVPWNMLLQVQDSWRN